VRLSDVGLYLYVRQKRVVSQFKSDASKSRRPGDAGGSDGSSVDAEDTASLVDEWEAKQKAEDLNHGR
jgi:hypothetical protein